MLSWRLLKGIHEETFYRIVLPNGEQKVLRSIWETEMDEHASKPIQGMVQDVTEHRKMEQRLRASENRYKSLFQHIYRAGACKHFRRAKGLQPP